MKKALRIFLYTLFSIVVVLSILVLGFVYKVKNGFPVFYEKEKPQIEFPQDQAAVLLFSKATGFRHSEAIAAAKLMFTELAQKNNWFLYETEKGGVFNPEQLAQFQVIIFNNSTGRVLNDEQQKALEDYVENGGLLMGIHGSGDDSHHWDWYEKNLLGAKFSHHPIAHQLQESKVILQPTEHSILWRNLSPVWSHTDEWYVFFEQPRKNGFTEIYCIDGESIDPSGNILFVRDKNFGMGKNHPVAWYKAIDKGKTFYTSIGHTGQAFEAEPFIQLLENVIRWQVDK